jgi:hypothetical protein
MILIALYLCVCLFASARRFLYDPMNWMSDWPDQFFRASATVFTDAVWPMILLRDFASFSISFFNLCTFYFAHNMFDKDSLACMDVFSLQLFRYMPYFLWETGHVLFEYLFALVIGPSLVFKECLIGCGLIPIFDVSVAWCGWFISFRFCLNVPI